jgi:TetR/AcrR family transcriptional repressor of nem operon
MGRKKEFDEGVVLQKAMELFWKQGYEKTSLNDLVEYTGINRGSLYETFVDKHSFFLRSMECYEKFIRTKLESEIGRMKTAKQAINLIFSLAIEENESLGCLFVNAATELAIRDKDVDKKTEEAFMQAEHLIAAIVLKGQQAGEFSHNHDAEVVAESLHTTLIGIRVLARTSTSKKKLRRIADFSLGILKR